MSDAPSSALFERACRAIPGGVNSPVRAFRAVSGEPLFIERAAGARLFAKGGGEYVDFIGSWGPMILGHAHPRVIEAVQSAATRGLSYGAPTELEVRFAERIIELYPSMEKIRCVSSGTEATMSAIRVARGFTKRDHIVKFSGCYHGHADHLLVKAGSGLATFGVPDSGGVPSGIASTTLTLEFNDEAALRALFESRGHDIAAVILEPVVGNMGTVAPAPGFLEAVIALCKQYGALSIFDEVMTGCRLSRGGAQQRFGLRPDMTTLGKIIGGGMPLAAYGARAEIMNVVAPLGPVYQAGTLSGNPIAVSAGLATLDLLDDALYLKLETLGAKLEDGLKTAIDSVGVEASVQRVGSMLTVFFSKGPITNWPEADKCDRKAFARFFHALLGEGIYFPPAQFEAAFLSGAHTEADIDRTVVAAKKALEAAAKPD